MNEHFRPDSARKFKSFVGELTAFAAATHLSLVFSKQMVEKNGASYWNNLCNLEGIKVDGIKYDELIDSNARLAVVSLYSGFDEYMKNLRKEYSLFFGKWSQNDGVGPLKAIKDNCPNNKVKLTNWSDKELLFDYYRGVRNLVVHPNEKDLQDSDRKYQNQRVDLSKVGRSYGMKEAPFPPDRICFHDIKLFCQLLLDITLTVSQAFDPGDELLASYVKKNYSQDRNRSHKRQANAIIGYLKTEFGVSDTRAGRIVDQILV